MTRSRRAQQGGFTLLEMLIAMAIIAIMMFITWSVTAQIADDKKFVARAADRNHELRIAMTRMVQDISMAYLSQNEVTDALERRTFFIGKGQSDAILRFSSLGHRVMWADANESEQTMISYYLDADPFDRRITNLYRRESRRMSDEGWDQVPAEVDVLARNVEELELEYWDWQDEEWQAEWDSTAGDGERGRLPERVKIKLTVPGRDRGDDPREYITQARIMMQQALRSFTD